ncbi:carboxypeptidase-like regulatory domain-containing protein [Mucilaginibacter segetis]|uniref:Carboxypeptidase-like regulatory domain-containing protein n=1 Tax=Mucilaginibacter segetis TaxID=2793071 RepID=A0A934PNM8_9SPHI|nr:carboxypeptidase-like regulatory domain-containing protein [Mucilaginibacter segetis]MBK0377883.1 carboxypeptidase-like regulatory domain-containing protein [Mucilaginibacter segetis]
MKYLLWIVFLLPVTCFAQKRISGKVINTDNGSPIPNASVFLSNATIGTNTSEDGSFTLKSVPPGQYELIVSVVGFETYRQTLLMEGTDINLATIHLKPRTIALSEVEIKPDVDFEKNYTVFKEEFLGSTEWAKQCTILNPEMLNLDYDSGKKQLHGSSYDFLVIENKALGYRLKYLLTDFLKDYNTSIVYFVGSTLFEEMDGTPSQKRRWKKRRKDTFEGSSMHFFRSIVSNNLDESGFRVLRLIRQPNPNYTAGMDVSKKIEQKLINKPLKIADFVTLTNLKGLFGIQFKDCLYIMYTKKKESEQIFSGVNKVSYRSNYLTSILTINGKYGLFDNNGIITNPEAVIIEGSWGRSRVAELLPVDYMPEP